MPPKLEVHVSTTPPSSSKRKSARRDSSKKKARDRSIDKSGTPSAASETDQSDDDSSIEVPETNLKSVAEKEDDACDTDSLKVTAIAAIASPVASRSSSESSVLHSRINSTRRESTLSASATPDSVLSRKRGSSTRSPSSSRGSSDSPTKLRKVSVQDRELTNSGSFSIPVSALSDASSSPSKRPTRTVSSEIHALKHELERERADRAILEAIVLEHQKLIETLNSKLERQSKIILSIQQSVEMFSRPQRIGHSPAASIVDPIFDRKGFDHASKEDDDEDHGVAPRKTKSARALSSSVHTKSKSKSSNEGDDEPRNKSSITFDDTEENITSPSSKSNKRKSKSSKELVVVLDSLIQHTPVKSSSKGTSEASSSSINSDAPSKKSKDYKDKDKDLDDRSRDEKEDKMKDKSSKDKEKRKSSRKQVFVVTDPQNSPSGYANGSDTPIKGPSLSAATTPASSVTSTPIADSKKEKRKSRRAVMSDDEFGESTENHGKSDSATGGGSIHFNSNPSIIPPYSGASPERPSAPRRSRSASERKSSTLRNDRDTASSSTKSRKKEAVTDVEDFAPLERKKRKVRRTLSDPDNPNGNTQSSAVDDIVPVKLKKKRRSERAVDRNGGVEIKSANSDLLLSSTASTAATSSPDLATKKARIKDNGHVSDKDSAEKRTKSSPNRISGTPARRKSASVSAGSLSNYSVTPTTERRKRPERTEGERKDSSASESYEPLAAEAAHESTSPEARRRTSAQQTIYSPGSKTQFRLSSRKLEMEEENALSPKRREVTSTRPGIALDLQSPKLEVRGDGHPSEAESGETPRGTSSSNAGGAASSSHVHPNISPRSAMLNIPALTISRGSSPSLTTSNDVGIGLELSLSSTVPIDPVRAQFEQSRDDREANILSPRGRDPISSSSSTTAPPLTSRSMAVHFLQTLPCNDIGIPVFLEQVCKFLLAEGTSSVALFEKRVDYARLENLRRRLEQTVSTAASTTPSLLSAANGGGGSLSSANSKLIAANIDRDLKGEDPYVVAGVLKRWFLDMPDTLLMLSKSRYWLDVLEITNTHLCIAGLQTLYYSLDLARRRVLRFFVDFLKQFVLASGGLATLEDVSSRFGPLLLRLPGASSPHATARGEPSAASMLPHSAVPSSISHTNSSSNLSGSTDDTHAYSSSAASALNTSGEAKNSSSASAAAGENAKAPSASAVPTHTRLVSRRGSARLEYELPPSNGGDGAHLPALLMKYLISRDSEILKNHDQGIEFSRRPDLQYVVRSASPNKILMLLIDQNYTEREFSQVIWDTCVYYTKPVALLSQFVALYDRVRGEAKWQSRLRMRILMAIKTWVKHSNFSLGTNKEFRALLQRFSTDVMKELKEKDAVAAAMGVTSNSGGTVSPPLQSSSLLAQTSGHHHTNSSSQVLDPESRILHSIMNASMFEMGSDDTWVQWKLQRLGSCEPFKFALHKHEPAIVAGQLTLIHCKLLSMIHASELTDNASLDPDRSPNYTGVVQHINCVSTWVAYDVLCRASVAERIRILTFYIDLSEQLLAIGDFMGCWAIRGAFDLHPVSRLTQTWERLPRKEASRNKKLAALFEPRMNFVEYRKALDVQLNETSFAVPILAFVPKDIIRLESNEPTFSEPGLVDVDKLRSIYYVLQHLSFANSDTFLKLHPTIKPQQQIWDFFANLPVIQEATLEQLSYNAEPRLAVPQNSRRIHSTSLSNPQRPTSH